MGRETAADESPLFVSVPEKEDGEDEVLIHEFKLRRLVCSPGPLAWEGKRPVVDGVEKEVDFGSARTVPGLPSCIIFVGVRRARYCSERIEPR